MQKETPFLYCWIFVLLLLPVAGVAQSAQFRQQIYPEKLHQDIDALSELIQQVHPDPFRYYSKAEFQRIVADVKDSIRVPLDMERFMERLLPIFHAVGDAHCGPQLPEVHSAHLLTTVPLLPLKVRILEEGVFVEEELKGFRSIPNGSRVISINGKAIGEVVRNLCDHIVADGANVTYKWRRIERELHILYALHVDRSSSFKVRYVTPLGDEQEGTVFAMTGEEILRSRKPEGAVLLPWRAMLEPESGAMWVSMSSLAGEELSNAGQRPEKFLDAMIKEAAENNVQTLVFDLRGAGGVDPEIAEQVYAMIAKEPFSLLDITTVRSTTPPHLYGLSVPQPEFYASVAGLAHLNSDGPVLVSSDPNPRSPSPQAYQGKVYVVCDGYTRDMASAFVSLAKRTGRATVIGEETGSNSAAFTGRSLEVTLPNSGLQANIPLERYVSNGPMTGATDRGEFPHHALLQDPRALALGKDAVRTSLLRLIRELQ